MTKKNKLIKLICNSAIMILFIQFLMPFYSAKADTELQKVYVALGDSISYGMNADSGKSYVDLFHNYLKTTGKYNNIELVNLSNSGDRSSDLIKIIADNQEIIKKSSIITISVGGNNITYPVITKVCKLFNVDYSNNTDLSSKLLEAVNSDEEAQSKLLGLLLDEDFEKSLTDGAAAFINDWKVIIDTVKAYAPNAQIYVTTVYNPFGQTDPFFRQFDLLIQDINKTIREHNDIYKVADVYNEFYNSKYILPLSSNFMDSITGIHPDNKGHEIIFEAHKKLYAAADDSTKAQKASTDNSQLTIEDIELNKTSSTLPMGSELQLSAAFSPSGTSIKDLVWKSSNESIAIVDSHGKLKAIKPGRAAITASTKDGNIKASCDIKVILPLTGSPIDFKILLLTGTIFLISGILLISLKL